MRERPTYAPYCSSEVQEMLRDLGAASPRPAGTALLPRLQKPTVANTAEVQEPTDADRAGDPFDDAGGERMTSTTTLDAALACAENGMAVLPLYTPDDTGHTGKEPRTLHGCRDATTNRAVIERWWSWWPESNVGVAMGAVSGCVGLDIDPARGGAESLSRLERGFGPLPLAPSVATGGSGQHQLFRHPGGRLRSRKDFLPGLELKGDGAYLVGPPSLHRSGRRYAWIVAPDAVPLPELPPLLAVLMENDGTSVSSDSTIPDLSAVTLPADFDDRLARDARLAGYFRRDPEYTGGHPSLSETALAIASRLFWKYPRDTEAERLGALLAFYQAQGRDASPTKLALTLRKAADRSRLTSPRHEEIGRHWWGAHRRAQLRRPLAEIEREEK